MNHPRCNFCGRNKVVVVRDGKGNEVLAPHFKKSGRRGGMCRKGTGAPLGARRDAA